MPDDAARFDDSEFGRAAAFRAELRRFLKRTEVVAAEAGLTAQRYDVLLMLKATDSGLGVPVTRLGELLQLRQVAVTELVQRMEQSGLIARRESSEDRRVSLIVLTAEGEARLAKTFAGLRHDRTALAATFARLVRFHDASA